MTSGAYPRRACPGCGRKTMTATRIGVSDLVDIPAMRCRSCECSFADGAIVQGPGRTVTPEMRRNRAAALLRAADEAVASATRRLAEAAEWREIARLLAETDGQKDPTPSADASPARTTGGRIRPFGPGHTHISDADRVARAVKVGAKMHGPLERCHCSRHNRRWITFRWVWSVGGEPDDGDVVMVHGCGSCASEDKEAATDD